jgi:putative ABC transport system permease protein
MLKATLRSIAGHRARLAMTGLAVILGVALMAGTLVLTDTLGRTFNQLFEDAFAGTDAVVRSSDVVEGVFGGEERAPIDASLLAIVRDTPGVAEAEGEAFGFAQLVTADGERLGNPGGGPPSFGRNWLTTEDLNPFVIAEGAPPTTSTDVVIDLGSANRGGVAVGDTITVLTASEPRQFTVSGIATFGEVDSPGGATVSLYDLATAQELFATPETFATIAAVAGPDVTQEELATAIGSRLPDGVEAITGAQQTEENQSAIAEALGFFTTFLLVFAVIALVVGAFIIYNTFSIVLAQRTRELALLRAVGASRRQVLTSVLAEAAVVGVVASAIGMGLGIAAAAGLRALLGATGVDVPSTALVVTGGTIATAIVTGTVITLVAAVLPARQAARIPPIAALRDVATEPRGVPVWRVASGLAVLALGAAGIATGLLGNGPSPLGAVGAGALGVFLGVTILGPTFARPVTRFLAWPLPRLRGITGTLSRENASRNPRRTATTAAALMIGVALVSFIAVFAASARASIDRIIDDSFTGDLIIDSGQFVEGGFGPQLAEEVAGVPGVAATTGVRLVSALLADGPQLLTGLNTATASEVIDPQVVSGRVDSLRADEVAISEQVATEQGLRVGDTLDVGLVAGPRTLTVAGTYDNRQLLGDYVVDTALANEATPNAFDIQVWAALEPGVVPADVEAEVASVAAPWPNAEVQDLTEFKEAQGAQFNQLLALVYALLGLAIVIALVGIANTLALSVYERTRELGLMRAVGMSRAQLRATIRWESVLIAIFGAVLGVAIGVVFGWAMITALASEGLGELAIPVVTLAIVVALAGIAGVVAALLPARRAARLDVLAAITSE